MKQENKKQALEQRSKYVPPTLTVVTFKTENGYALSATGGNQLLSVALHQYWATGYSYGDQNLESRSYRYDENTIW